VTEYQIIQGLNLAEIQTNVEVQLAGGWDLYGDPFGMNGAFYQAMTK